MVSKTATLDFGLFRDLVDRISWEAVLKGRNEFFKKEILKA